jgi:hypothetical protein
MAVLLLVASVAAAIYETARWAHALRGWVQRVNEALSQLSFQAKIKVVISFYQVASTLDTVYGVPDR